MPSKLETLIHLLECGVEIAYWGYRLNPWYVFNHNHINNQHIAQCSRQVGFSREMFLSNYDNFKLFTLELFLVKLTTLNQPWKGTPKLFSMAIKELITRMTRQGISIEKTNSVILKIFNKQQGDFNKSPQS